MSIVDILMRTAVDRRRRAPYKEFRTAVLHPANFSELEREIRQAEARQEWWAISTIHSPFRSANVVVLPNGLEVRCSPGFVEGWAVLEDFRGSESMTMVNLRSDDSAPRTAEG